MYEPTVLMQLALLSHASWFVLHSSKSEDWNISIDLYNTIIKKKQTNKQNEDIKPKKVLKKKYYLYPESMKYGKKSNFYLDSG